MNRYIDSLKRNPLDVGLEESEVTEYSFRPIFVLSGQPCVEQEADTVPFSAMHQFLQKELVYTDTSRAVREIAKMAERRQLSHGQIRLLAQSLRPYEDRIQTVVDDLKKLEEDYSSLELHKPFEKGEAPVDVVVRHKPSGQKFYFDIPYSREELTRIDDRVEELKQMVDTESQVYYAAVNTFEEVDSDFIIRKEKLEKEIDQTLGVLSVEKVADVFEPKVKCSRSYGDGFIQITPIESHKFSLKVITKDDRNFKVEATLSEDIIERLKDRKLNSGNSFGRIEDGRFIHDFKVEENLQISFDSRETDLSSYRRTVSDYYHSVVSSALGKKVKKKV